MTPEPFDPYAVLELSPGAPVAEIDAAYQRLTHFLAEGSLVSYGMLDNGEATRLRQQLEQAYYILCDETRRTAYDAGLRQAPPVAAQAEAVHKPQRRGRPTLEVPLARELPADKTFDGALLRRLRESAGASLEDFSEWSKISRRYLLALETDDFALLPAAVYVRGFVSEYARLLGLEAHAVAKSYLQAHSRWRTEQP